MSNLPVSWIQVPLQSLVSLNEKLRDINDDENCGFVPMNLLPTKLLGHIQYEQKKWGACKNGYTHFKDGDVLLAKITPCFENGKSVLVSGLPNGIGAGSTEYFVLRSKWLNSRYLHAFVKTKQFKDDCTVHMSGSVGHKRVPKDYLLEYPIPVAPLNEQIRIADKLDSLLAKVDEAQARLEKIPILLKRFRQSVLAAATSGELTRDWKINNGYKAEWKYGVWSDILRPGKDSFKRGPFGSSLKKNMFVDKGYKVYEQYCPINDDCNFARYYITPEKFEEMKAFEVIDFDFLISCSGVSLGRITQVPKNSEKGIINQALLRVRIDSTKYCDAFFKMLFRSPRFQKAIFENSTGSAIPNLKGVKELKAMSVPLPNIEEQKEIIRRVESLFAQADAVEKQYLAAKQRLDRLSQSLLAKAFRGELVPQDPSDEPAAELLKRIQAERQAKTPATRRGT